jgi:hypothetical protein
MLILQSKQMHKYMNYSQRYHELNALFQLGVDTHLVESDIDIRFYSFKSLPLSAKDKTVIANPVDETINENLAFVYPVFVPHKIKKSDNAILLMHGLNERNWSKYLTWAEYLCEKTGKPVILFPIAFHMNRSPLTWSNPRALKPLMDFRRKLNGEDRSLSFANVALSERISEKPIRFYNSGRQSMFDLTQLFSEIKQGLHPLFAENTQIDIFSYSIGAFLSQITVMTNPNNLFSDSKLFMFCGGGIFSSMLGESRSIMDKPAFARLLEYYMTDFETEATERSVHDKGFESFFSMISPERNQTEREGFFKRLGNKVSGISLAKDHVIPYEGVVKALGTECAKKCIKLFDFNFQYTHENPFPVGNIQEMANVDTSFTTVFSNAAQFLA